MDISNKVDSFIQSNKKYFPENKIILLREKLLQADENTFIGIASLTLKDPTTILIMSIFFGWAGVDRFMIGEAGMGALKLLTFGCCFVLWIADWFIVPNRVKEQNYNNIMMAL